MSLAPRVVVVHRRTELAELVDRHGTLGQAGFFLTSRGGDLADLVGRDAAVGAALGAVSAMIPPDWRRGRVERDDLPRFLFAPEDVVVVVGQDGLVANVAKYLDGQPVIGVDPEPGRNPGVLVRHRAVDVPTLLRDAVGDASVEERTMVAAESDDGSRLFALNEVYVGHRSHQTARYHLVTDGGDEHQASSGLLVATGTGATGWCRSVWRQRAGAPPLPSPVEHRLLWFVREAWPSPSTGATRTEGELSGTALRITVESDAMVAFADGIESDAVPLSRGQTITLRRATRTLRLL